MLTPWRVGLQAFGAQHVSAIGDLHTPEEAVPTSWAIFWSLVVAVVIC